MLTPHEGMRRRSKPPHAYHVGSVIAGKYRVKRLLGHGGMGAVYKAENLSIGRTVAVKVLHPHLADDGVTLARFQREARAAASVGHGHVVEVLDLGVEASGAPFLVMEYVRGKSVEKLLTSEGTLSPRRACDIAGQVLDGLAAVHARGIIHRDLKPENILLTVRHGRTDFVKIHDFGVATFVEGARDPNGPHDLTPSGRTMGTPYYAAPEQLAADGRGLDARVDLFAVGVVLFEMVAGHRPFLADNFADLCRQILHDEPPPLRVFTKHVPEALERVICKLLSKQAADRYPDATAAIEALVPFGARPPLDDDPEPTDTFTVDLRELRERERQIQDSEPPPAIHAAEDDVRGEVVVGIREFLKHQLGEAVVGELIAAAPPEIHARYVAGIDRTEWYPDDVLQLLELADRRFGDDDRTLIADAGRFFARALFTQGHFPRGATPELLFSTLSDLWKRFFRGGTPRVLKLGRGYGLLEVSGHPSPRLARSVAMVGFLDQGMRLAGAREVDARLSKAAALGDPFDLYEASWST